MTCTSRVLILVWLSTNTYTDPWKWASSFKKDLYNAYQFSAPACEKAWIYERVPGFELAGYDDKIEKAVLTRKECQEKCLKDTDLPCRSAEYDYTTFTCRLSRETRRSQPAAYRYYLIISQILNFVVKLQITFTERQPMMSITWKTSALIHVAMECAITRNTLNLI